MGPAKSTRGGGALSAVRHDEPGALQHALAARALAVQIRWHWPRRYHQIRMGSQPAPRLQFALCWDGLARTILRHCRERVDREGQVQLLTENDTTLWTAAAKGRRLICENLGQPLGCALSASTTAEPNLLCCKWRLRFPEHDSRLVVVECRHQSTMTLATSRV